MKLREIKGMGSETNIGGRGITKGVEENRELF